MLAHPTHERLITLGLAGLSAPLTSLRGIAQARWPRRSTSSAASPTSPRLPSRSVRRSCSSASGVTERENKRLAARLKFAALRQAAVVEDVDLRAARGLDRALFQKLVAGDWIDRRQNLLIVGPAGVGKSWLARALGHKACRDDRSVLCHHVPRLLETLALARGDGRYARLLKTSPACSCRSSTTGDWRRPAPNSGAICSRSWTTGTSAARPSSPASCRSSTGTRSSAARPSIADAILDRLVHNAHRLTLKGESMRKLAAKRAPLDEGAAT
jgi:DNA replication protein DnaC